MATVLWDKFYPYLQPYVSGCPEIVMEAHLQEAAAKFFERSEVWRFDIEKDFAVKNVADYAIFLPSSEAVLENVYEIVLDGRVIPRISDRHLKSTAVSTKACPKYYSIYQDASIKFYPTPDAKYEFTGSGVLKTKLTATGIEDWIFESHGRCIAYGAISQLTSVPNKEWSNPELSVYYNQKFLREADAAKTRDYRRVGMRVRGPNFTGAKVGAY
jgi:hypothetical protein